MIPDLLTTCIMINPMVVRSNMYDVYQSILDKISIVHPMGDIQGLEFDMIVIDDMNKTSDLPEDMFVL